MLKLSPLKLQYPLINDLLDSKRVRNNAVRWRVTNDPRFPDENRGLAGFSGMLGIAGIYLALAVDRQELNRITIFNLEWTDPGILMLSFQPFRTGMRLGS